MFVPSHDIAVLVLEKVLPNHVEIALADAVDDSDKLELVGFGYDDPELATGFGAKREVEVPMVKPKSLEGSDLAAAEAKHGYSEAFELYASRRGLGKDSCNGDSGGPAYIGQNGNWLLSGITSRASHDAVARCGGGGIYTRVAPYLDWIASVAGEHFTLPGGPEVPEGGGGDVRLYGAMPNPDGPDAGYGWFELVNDGPRANLAELSLHDDDGGAGQQLGGGVLDKGERLRVPLDPSKLRLGNRGDVVFLKRGDEVISRGEYPSASSGEVVFFEQGPPAPSEPPPEGGGEQPPPGGRSPTPILASWAETMRYDLVFEGGGAKGMVFVGAMQAFEGAGLTYDRLLGTSAGAITATLLAAGYTSKRMLDALGEKERGRPVFAGFMGVPGPFSEQEIEESATLDLLSKIDFLPP